MSELNELYQQVILDHNKNPRNYGALKPCTHFSEGFNPLCGDHFDIYAVMDGDTIKDISFEGSGCAISKSSASIMTSLVKGKTKAEAETMIEQFQDLVTMPMDQQPDEDKLGKLAVFAGVREFPARIKCASLAWHTLKAAIEQQPKAISTE
jgi:nitrogen fixation NifU-like protein